ncbi:MAG: tetratricopeptide repeat protein [Holophagales bacterium]|nr:tetratricopeptide repeat protein [Holophagales bacterium]
MPLGYRGSGVLLLGLLVWMPAEAEAQLPEGTDEEAQLMLEEGRSLAEAGRASEALPFYEQAVDMAEARLGAESPTLAYLHHELGSVYRSISQVDRAELEYRRALGIFEATFGAEHAELLPALADLASLLTTQNRVAEAETLYRRTLRLLVAAREEGDPEVVHTLGQLALLADQQGREGEAEALYRRSVDLADAGGQESPELASSLNNLASLHHRRDELAEAEELYRRALDLRERLLGPNHWHLAVSLSDLGLVVARQGREEEGLELATRASAILSPYCGGLTAEDPAEKRSASELCRDTEALRANLKTRLGGGAGSSSVDPVVDAEALIEPAPQPVQVASEPEARAPSAESGIEPPPQAVQVVGQIFRAQLASREDLEQARSDQAALRQRYPAQLEGTPGHIETIDLGAKGIWHRIQFGNYPTRERARDLCRALKSAGWADCWVVSSGE